MENNYPIIYIYGDSAKGNTSEDAKVRLAFGRERKEPERIQESDWVCKMVRTAPMLSSDLNLTYDSVTSTTFLPE